MATSLRRQGDGRPDRGHRPDVDREAAARRPKGDAYGALLGAIVGQQLSVKAAATIFDRVLAIFGGSMPTAQELLRCRRAELRGAGLSGRKVEYLKDLASKTEIGELELDRFGELDDETIVAELTAVRGLGVWTAHMFLIFHLERPDVLPVGRSRESATRSRRLRPRRAALHPAEMERDRRALAPASDPRVPVSLGVALERAGRCLARTASDPLPSLRRDGAPHHVRRGARAWRADLPRGHPRSGRACVGGAPGALRGLDRPVLARQREVRRLRGGLRLLRSVALRRSGHPDARDDGARADPGARQGSGGGGRAPVLHGDAGPGAFQARLRADRRGREAGFRGDEPQALRLDRPHLPHRAQRRSRKPASSGSTTMSSRRSPTTPRSRPRSATRVASARSTRSKRPDSRAASAAS